MSKAFLVYGPESSGTRLMRRILIAAGCEGAGDLEQDFDTFGLPPSSLHPLIVWGHSIPGHVARDWPPFDLHFKLCQTGGYDIVAIVMVRDWFAMAQSQIDHTHAHAESLLQAIETTGRAYKYLFSALDKHNVPYLMISYDNLVKRPKWVIGHLFGCLGLELQSEIEKIKDGNSKYTKRTPKWPVLE